jgi:hypothetical protein
VACSTSFECGAWPRAGGGGRSLRKAAAAAFPIRQNDPRKRPIVLGRIDTRRIISARPRGLPQSGCRDLEARSGESDS